MSECPVKAASLNTCTNMDWFIQLANPIDNKYYISLDLMESPMPFSENEAREIGDKIGIDWSKIDFNEFRMGLEVELEHGNVDPRTNVTNNDPVLTGKIAWAHLNELPDYYSRLKKIEEE